MCLGTVVTNGQVVLSYRVYLFQAIDESVCHIGHLYLKSLLQGTPAKFTHASGTTAIDAILWMEVPR